VTRTREPVTGAATLQRELAARVDAEVRFDPGTKAAYAHDASNYRQVPVGVVVPRTVDAAVGAIAVCRQFDAPVLSRGGGTSLAGQAGHLGREGVHLAQLLAGMLGDRAGQQGTEDRS
jgi:FAD/FMN-containing dehydrogenase